MVDNFTNLKSELPRVPMRVDHSATADKVVGHIQKVWRDGEFLMADVSLTEPEAVQKYKRGTYHSRSAEVGPYRTNDERWFDQVLRGVAFVDLPAVEGLFTLATNSTGVSDVTDDEMTARIAELEEQLGNATTRISELEASNKVDTAGTFRLAGVETDDHEAVQAAVLQLEKENGELNEFVAASISTDRENFVKGLAEAKVIMQPQVEHFSLLAVDMSPEQFETFKAGWESAGVASVFSTEAQNDGEPQGDPVEVEGPTKLDLAKEQVEAFRMTSIMSEEDIQKTDSYRLVAAAATQEA